MSTLEGFVDQVLGQVEECIGCTDCLTACPIPEKAAVTIADLNEAASSNAVMLRSVARFVDACTQCQRCVPVCPADLSRADMVLLNKLKLGDATGRRELRDAAGAATGWTVESACRVLEGSTVLGSAEPSLRRRLVGGATLHRGPPGAVLVSQGDYHDALYVVLLGEVGVQQLLQGGTPRLVLRLGPGEVAGEAGVLAHQKESFGLVVSGRAALEEAVLLAIPGALVRAITAHCEPLRQALQEVWRPRAIVGSLAENPLFGALPADFRQEILGGGTVTCLQAGEVLPVNQLAGPLVVLGGFLAVEAKRSQSWVRRDYKRRGDIVGVELCLVDSFLDTTSRYVAVSEVWALELDAGPVRRRVEQHPELRIGLVNLLASELGRLGKHTESYKAVSAAGGQASSLPPGQTARARMTNAHLASPELAMAEGEILLIDLERCIDCDACVDACGQRHGHPRLRRQGKVLGHFLLPRACYHCADPVCLLCQVNAIQRLTSGAIQIDPATCTACGACAEACPYDNIVIGPRRAPTAWQAEGVRGLLGPRHLAALEPFAWLRRALGLAGEAASPEDPTPAAHKCDLCSPPPRDPNQQGQEARAHPNQACVAACPTGAIFRTTTEAFRKQKATP